MTLLTSELRKQKLREVKGLAQGHTVEWQLWMFCSSYRPMLGGDRSCIALGPYG